MQAATLTYDPYIGRQACGRILEGTITKGQLFTRVDKDGKQTQHRVVKIEGHLGLKKVEMEKAACGDIVTISGALETMIGDTLCDPAHVVQLPPIALAEPTMSVEISVNNGPFVGKDGKHVTMNKIRDRLEHERKANISLKIEEVASRDDAIRVCGRGELHLSVLIEAMRREDFEFVLSRPQVILRTIDGVVQEPLERVHIEVPQEFSGGVIQELSMRKGEMQSLDTNEHGITFLMFLIPTRGLMGYRNEFLTLTRGLGILTSTFYAYAPLKGEIPSRQKGTLISNGSGKVTAYSSFGIQERGTLFVNPGDEVYEGLIVGEHNRENDLVVNVVKGKALTNVRASGNDENIILTPPRTFTLEQAIDFVQDDELVEVTPHFIRLRKRHLSENERKRKD
jgi:GTP-binding protein